MKIDGIYNLKICGVGGQGVLFTSRVIGACACSTDLKVKISHLYGVAQRGGSVTSDIRISSQDIFCPEIVQGAKLHALLGLEPYETLRAHRLISRRTTVIINTDIIPFKSEDFKYPSASYILGLLRRLSNDIVEVRASSIVTEYSKGLGTNMVVLGCLIAKTGLFPLRIVKRALRKLKFSHKINIKLVELGYDYACNLSSREGKP